MTLKRAIKKYKVSFIVLLIGILVLYLVPRDFILLGNNPFFKNLPYLIIEILVAIFVVIFVIIDLKRNPL